MGIEPGMSDVFAKYASDHLFSKIDSITILDGSNLTVEGYEFAPSFSIWTTIEECLNPPIVWEDGRGWHTTERHHFSTTINHNQLDHPELMRLSILIGEAYEALCL